MTRKIKELWHGDVFTYGGISWTVIAQEEKGGRVLTMELQALKPFDEGESKDWRAASLKEYMNGDLLKTFTDGGADPEKIIEADVDLIAINGSTDYGTDACKVAPMTEAVYRVNKLAIPKVAEPYWLVTPYSHEEPYIGGAYMHQVMIVRPDGSMDGSAADGGVYGVRACCVLDPETEVELTESDLDKKIEAILTYDNPIVTIEGVTDLASGLKTQIQKAATECENIPAVKELKPETAEIYRSVDAVTLYTTMRNNSVQGISARVLVTILKDKL